MINTKKKVLLALIIIMLGGIGYFIAKEPSTLVDSSLPYITEFVFKEEDKLVEIRVLEDTKQTVLYINGKKQETLLQTPKEAKGVLKLPKVSEAIDTLSKKESKVDMAWGSTLEDSAKYLKFLKKKGYKVKREVRTPQYIEYFLMGEEKKKRVILFNNSIIVGDLYKDSRMPKLEEYLREYK